MSPWRRTAVATTCGAGGAVWSSHVLLLASRPEGCIAAACALRPHRPSEDVAGLLLVALLLLATGSAVFAADAPVRARRPLRWGAGLVAAGAALLALGVVVNASVTDSPLWWLHDSDSLARLLPVLGGAVTGWAVLRGAMMPSWVGVALLAGAVVSFGVNVQDHRVLLGLPLGLAWTAFGHAAWRTGEVVQ